MILTCSRNAFTCQLCIWIDPQFAGIFGFGVQNDSHPVHAVAEVADIIRYINWVMLTSDFNGDYFPENVGFSIGKVLVSLIEEVDETEEPKPMAASLVKILSQKFAGVKCCGMLAYLWKNFFNITSVGYRSNELLI